jgi:hypothetical protein
VNPELLLVGHGFDTHNDGIEIYTPGKPHEYEKLGIA